MTDVITCPNCNTSLRKGSTFCMKCGTALNGRKPSSTPDPVPDSVEASDSEAVTSDEATLPEMEDWDKLPDDTDDLMAATVDALDESERLTSEESIAPPDIELPPADEISWDEGLDSKRIPELIPEVPVIDEALDDSIKKEDPTIEEPPAVEPTSRDLSWETPKGYSPEIKEGMPFKEVAPPTVVDEDVIEVTEAREHLFTDAHDEGTREAVTHLFPHGRGETSTDFIDIVVGKPKRIGADISPSVLETPTCPDCGSTIGSDSFEYPPYVYDAMGKARMAQGIHLLKESDHENAIEQFEIAKKLFEHGGHKKLVDDATKHVDVGYDAMAEHHYIQAENHLKEKQYEWAIVQFKKARELYMFSTDAKKRAKCSHRARDAYEHWGKSIEEEGDKLSKSGQTRDALAKYTEAAEKYREADIPKKLRGLEKKIRNA